MRVSKRICLVGPDPKIKISGGVATHMRVLAGLSIFSNSEICDIGSLNGENTASVAGLIRGFINFVCKTKRSDAVLINASIYLGSLIKLFIQLFLLPSKKNRLVFVFFHGGMFNRLRWKERFVNMALRSLSSRVTSFMFLTNKQMESFVNCVGEFPVRQYMNYSSESHVLEKIQHEDDIRFLYVGRITDDKGVFECLEAFRLFRNKIPKNARLVFVGEGESFACLKQVAKLHEISNVEFKGYLEGAELSAEYRMADLLLLPSLHEGFPYVFIEAMQSGVPVVATRVGVFPEVIINGNNGYLVSRDPEDIARAMENYIAERGVTRFEKQCYTYFIENLSGSSANDFYVNLLQINEGGGFVNESNI